MHIQIEYCCDLGGKWDAYMQKRKVPYQGESHLHPLALFQVFPLHLNTEERTFP